MRIRDKIDLKTLIIISNVIFILLYVILASNNRIAHDDYYSIYIVNKLGVIDSVIYQYNNWCTRYISVFLSFTISSLLKYKYTLFIYNIILLKLFVISVYYSLNACKSILNESARNDKLQILNYSVFFVSAIFYASFNIGETWFWLSSTSTYLLSVIMLFFAFSFIFNNKGNMANKISITLVSVFIGGSNGTLSLLLLLVLFVLFLLYKQKNKLIANKLLLSFVCVLISFLILYSGNGNNIRSGSFNSISVLDSFILNIKTTAIILFMRVPNILIYILLFIIPTFHIFGNTQNITKSTFTKRFLVSTSILLSLLFVFQLPITYKTQDVAAVRTLLPISILFFIYGLYLIYNINQIESFRLRIPKTFAPLVLVCIILFNFWNLQTQYKVTENYASKYDERIETIKKLSHMDTIALKPLPSSGFLYSSEITFDANHFSNKQMKVGLQKKSELILRKTKHT